MAKTKEEPQSQPVQRPDIGDTVIYWHGSDENCDRDRHAAIVADADAYPEVLIPPLGLAVIFPGHHALVPREAVEHQSRAKKGEACWTFRGEPRTA